MDGMGSEIDRIVAVNRARLGLGQGRSKGGSAPALETAAGARLAVYGTLRPGQSSAHMLEPYGGSWRKGTVTGYQSGVCTADGCPGLAWDPAGDLIEVMVLDAPGLAGAWDVLDAYEGADYARLLVPVTLEGGERVLAQTYASADATRTRLIMWDGNNCHETVDDARELRQGQALGQGSIP